MKRVGRRGEDAPFGMLPRRANGENRYELFGVTDNLFDKGQLKQLRLFGVGLSCGPFGQGFEVGARRRF
jgi:hypothetical protein